jgi:hypothetical protein
LSKSQLTDADAEKLWDSMVLAGDPRPLLLMLSEYRKRESFVAHAAMDAGKVSAVVRQAIQAVTNPENKDAAKGFERRMKEVLAVRYSVPESPTIADAVLGNISK